ncbi:MAG TPA: nuclear transport factor 2 family protein [Steroidobacteraceae bacterium]|nr:nuclear transport factor 2 family protein [Steroidobacteraceae bacterium]
MTTTRSRSQRALAVILVALTSATRLVFADTAAQHAAATEASRRLVMGYARLLFVQHDPAHAFRDYFSSQLIQHDPDIADGNHGDEDFLSRRRKAHPAQYLPTQEYATVVDNILADGDLVAIKSHLYTNPHDRGRAFVDIWRVAAGRFVEHWDVIQAVPDKPLNSASMWCGHSASYASARQETDTVTRPACGSVGPAAHRDAALATVEAYTAMGQDAARSAEAVHRYISDDFVQHSPHIAQGKQALEQYFDSRAHERATSGRTSWTAHVLADGDFVLTHRLVTSRDSPRGQAYADLYRVRDGQVVEHWDVIQPIPAYSVAGHSMVIGPLEPHRNAGASSLDHCTSTVTLQFLCGPSRVEDVVPLSGRSALVGSSAADPSGSGPGMLLLIDTASRTYSPLAIRATAPALPTYAKCPGPPDLAKFAPHGLAIRPLRSGHEALYVVNHGGRESIEIFDLSTADAHAALRWLGCAVLPAGASGNGVAALPDGGFVATKFLDTARGGMIPQLVSTEKNGVAYRWSPVSGFTTLRGSEGVGDNGIEVSQDARWVFIDIWGEKEILRLALDGSAEPRTVSVPFLPDNIHRARDGTLIVTGQVAELRALPSCFATNCPLAWEVDRLNPDSLRRTPLLREKGSSAFGGASGACEAGRELWIASVFSDRLAIVPKP